MKFTKSRLLPVLLFGMIASPWMAVQATEGVVAVNPCAAGKSTDPMVNKTVQDAMRSFVTQQTAGNGLMPVVHEGKVLQLKLFPSKKYPDAFHAGVAKEGSLFASCADFIDPNSGKKYDIDFLVNKNGGNYNVVQPIVHGIDGKKSPYDLSH